MKIYFLRHGEAEEKKKGMEDKDRPLTSLGAATISNMARSLTKVIENLDLIFTSPYLRAAQTADIVGNIFGKKDNIVRSENLLVGTPSSELLNEIKRYKDTETILLIGHQPQLGICVSFLTGVSEDNITIKKGSCAFVNIGELKENAGELVWIKDAASLK
jgi:phosphohistidine phosphatase